MTFGTLKAIWTHYLPSRTELRFRDRARAMARRPLEAALTRVAAHADPAESSEAPIFILSAGWRSGSTLLQRLVSSATPRLVWGEPFHNANLVQRLAESLSCFTDSWPTPDMYYDYHRSSRLQETWIANLFPSADDLRASHRALLDRLFSEPARREGYTGWGLKEVRFGGAEIDYLRWLYPHGRFLLLVRDPLTAWLSYKGCVWFERWPERPVYSVSTFARLWQRLAADFVDRAQAPRTALVRYEDLCAGDVSFDRLEEVLGARPDPAVLEQRIRGPNRIASGVLAVERRQITLICGRTARAAGYDYD